MNQTKINLLESEGFCWAHESKRAKKWHDMYAKLVKYKEEYGNCDAPKKSNKYQNLGSWVDNQRSLYRHRKQGRTRTQKRAVELSLERIRLLEKIGFRWSAAAHVTTSTEEPSTPSRKVNDEEARKICSNQGPSSLASNHQHFMPHQITAPRLCNTLQFEGDQGTRMHGIAGIVERSLPTYQFQQSSRIFSHDRHSHLVDIVYDPQTTVYAPPPPPQGSQVRVISQAVPRTNIIQVVYETQKPIYETQAPMIALNGGAAVQLVSLETLPSGSIMVPIADPAVRSYVMY